MSKQTKTAEINCYESSLTKILQYASIYKFDSFGARWNKQAIQCIGTMKELTIENSKIVFMWKWESTAQKDWHRCRGRRRLGIQRIHKAGRRAFQVPYHMLKIKSFFWVFGLHSSYLYYFILGAFLENVNSVSSVLDIWNPII
jgi:hypothetical protein